MDFEELVIFKYLSKIHKSRDMGRHTHADYKKMKEKTCPSFL